MGKSNAQLTSENSDLKERIAQLEAAGASTAGVTLARHFAGPPSQAPEGSLDDDTVDALRELAEQLDPRDHLRDCPEAEDDFDGVPNVEAYGSRAPRVEKRDGTVVDAHDVTVVRCITCGGASVKHEALSDFRDRLAG